MNVQGPSPSEPVSHQHSALYDAAIAAEQATGKHENTEAAARSHILVRIGRIAFGTLLLLTGLVMMVLPGPGLVAILAGLAILAVDVPFAARLHKQLLERADKATSFIPAKVRTPLIILGVLVGLGVTILTVLRFF